ncbi:hypothetical protein [Oleidesulfovibrio sp.]|uniref:MotE family protein n=1 Tax=Oleidesulfovibrio sp. TaxID=2909707 RepID=UPI003A896EF8
MTKQPHFATSLRLSKLCKWLFLVLCMKLTVLGTLMWDGTLTGFTLSQPVAVSTPATLPAASKSEALSTGGGAAGFVASGEGISQGRSIAAPVAASLPLLSTSQAVAAEDPAASDTAAESAGTDMQREALLRKEEELNRRETDLRKLERELDTKIQNLQALEDRLAKMLEEAGEVKDKKLRHLVDVYSNMKAKQAAAVLETLDEKIAVRILAGMRGRQAGEILSFVNAQKAARLSEALTKMQLPFE